MNRTSLTVGYLKIVYRAYNLLRQSLKVNRFEKMVCQISKTEMSQFLTKLKKKTLQNTTIKKVT